MDAKAKEYYLRASTLRAFLRYGQDMRGNFTLSRDNANKYHYIWSGIRDCNIARIGETSVRVGSRRWWEADIFEKFAKKHNKHFVVGTIPTMHATGGYTSPNWEVMDREKEQSKVKPLDTKEDPSTFIEVDSDVTSILWGTGFTPVPSAADAYERLTQLEELDYAQQAQANLEERYREIQTDQAGDSRISERTYITFPMPPIEPMRYGISWQNGSANLTSYGLPTSNGGATVSAGNGALTEEILAQPILHNHDILSDDIQF